MAESEIGVCEPSQNLDNSDELIAKIEEVVKDGIDKPIRPTPDVTKSSDDFIKKIEAIENEKPGIKLKNAEQKIIENNSNVVTVGKLVMEMHDETETDAVIRKKAEKDANIGTKDGKNLSQVFNEKNVSSQINDAQKIVTNDKEHIAEKAHLDDNNVKSGSSNPALPNSVKDVLLVNRENCNDKVDKFEKRNISDAENKADAIKKSFEEKLTKTNDVEKMSIDEDTNKDEFDKMEIDESKSPIDIEMTDKNKNGEPEKRKSGSIEIKEKKSSKFEHQSVSNKEKNDSEVSAIGLLANNLQKEDYGKPKNSSSTLNDCISSKEKITENIKEIISELKEQNPSNLSIAPPLHQKKEEIKNGISNTEARNNPGSSNAAPSLYEINFSCTDSDVSYLLIERKNSPSSPVKINKTFEKVNELCTFVISEMTKIKNNITIEDTVKSPETQGKTKKGKLSIISSRNEQEKIKQDETPQKKKENNQKEEDGERVLAKWIDKKYYAGKIIDEKPGNKFNVLFEDGASKLLPKESIVFGEDGVLPLADQVLYASVDDDYELGKVLAVEKKTGSKVIYEVEVEKKTYKLEASDIYLTEEQAKHIRKLQQKGIQEASTEDSLNTSGRSTRKRAVPTSPDSSKGTPSKRTPSKGNKRQKKSS